MPLVRAVYFLGEEQALKAALSSLHSKVEFASLEEKANVAELVLTVPEGPESMVVSGGVVSCGGGAAAAVVKSSSCPERAGCPPSPLPR